MNDCKFTGRFTATPELTLSANGIPNCKFALAIDPNYTAKGKEQKANYLNFIAWKHQAEFICKYFAKGNKILIKSSEAVAHSYEDKNGVKRNTVEFTVGEVEFVGTPSKNTAAAKGESPTPQPIRDSGDNDSYKNNTPEG